NARADDGKPACQIPIHDALRSLRYFIYALQGTASDKKPDQDRSKTHDAESQHQRPANDITEPLGFTQITTDKKPHAVRQCDHDGNGAMFRLCALLAITAISETALDDAVRIQNTRFHAFHVARKDATCRVGDQIEIGAGLARTIVDGAHKLRNAAARIAFADAGDFLAQRLLGLRG